MEDRLRLWPPEAPDLAEGWEPVVEAFFKSTVGTRLNAFIRERLDDGAVIYPPEPLRALAVTPLASVRAVIIGQDPYHGPGQAEGLAFSVRPGVRPPPSLQNIFRELHGASNRPKETSGSLLSWAQRGVLLLNTSLTVEDGVPGSHAKKGWESFTDALIAQVAVTSSPCVYLLWGAHAQAKAALIDEHANKNGCEHLILKANHPSPLSARRPPVPFVGCGHFALAREWLAARGHTDIF